jgi:phospholipase C
MKRWLVLIPTVATLLGFAIPARPAVVETSTTAIQHVVVILKENRSYDSYFGQFPNAAGSTTGTMSNGTIVDLTQHPTPEPLNHDIGHSLSDFNTAYDGGKLDKFDLEKNAIFNGVNNAYTQMSESQIPNYWQYARTYALADNLFSDYKGSSFGNNLFFYAAQSGREDPALAFRGVLGLPKPPKGQSLNTWWGCDDPVGTTVQMLGSDGTKAKVFPCFGFQGLPNILAANGVSWKVYAPLGDHSNLHNVLDAISPVRNDPALWGNDVALSNFVNDAANGTLPDVSWVATTQTEHPTQLACTGENETVSYVNAVMNGPLWSSTAIFVVWDEWGGFYDHVPPPQIDNYSYGFRVPMLIISPWTKYGVSSNGGYVEHTFLSHSSILKFIEDNWGLPALTARDAGANNIMDAFDFTQTPKPTLTLTSRTCPALTAAQQASANSAGGED